MQTMKGNALTCCSGPGEPKKFSFDGWVGSYRMKGTAEQDGECLIVKAVDKVLNVPIQDKLTWEIQDYKGRKIGMFVGAIFDIRSGDKHTLWINIACPEESTDDISNFLSQSATSNPL
jgi:hypothetical protein